MSRLKISFIPTEVSGVNFYRCWQPAEALRAKGYDVAVLWYSSRMFIRDNWELGLMDDNYAPKIIKDIEMACFWADVVVWMAVHNELSWALWQNMRLKYPNKKFIMEIDDNLLSIPSYNAAFEVYNHGNPMTQFAVEQMRKSDALVVSTPGLKEIYSEFADKVYIIENVIDARIWPEANKPKRTINIGWVGGATHTEDLETVKDVIFQILAKHKNVNFVCLHGVPHFFKHLSHCRANNRPLETPPCIECGGHPQIEWSPEFASIKKYPKWVGGFKFHIGIAPLVDNNFNRGKSNLRWLEYSALGIPTVASNVGHFKETLRDGETGFLVNSENEWFNALERLLDDPGLRDNIGKNARREVMKNWCPKRTAEKYLSVFEEIHARSNAKQFDDAGESVGRGSVQPTVHDGASPS